MAYKKSDIVKLVCGVSLATFIGAAMHFAPAQAAEIEVSSRYIDQKSKSEFVKVGDKEGHVVGSYSTTGVETYDNGEIALRFVGGTFDFVNWAGPVAGRTLVVHEDGSTITYEWEGATKFDEKKASFSEGTHRCASGTGRFEGVKCEGTWKVNHQKNGMHLGSHKTKMKLPD